MNDYDDLSDYEELFSKRKDRRKPKGKRSVKELEVSKAEATSSNHKFSDPSLQTLYERGFISEILGQIKSGKEATVYLVESLQGLAAAKVYSDMAVRSFKDDSIYRQGRFVGDARIKKAIEQRSRSGVNAQQALWIYHEYTQLWELYNAGIPTPKPLIGPGSDDMISAGRVVLMDYIGDADEPAPRLSDLRLDEETAQDAWQQSLTILVDLIKMGKVHGDFSTYNLLWWDGKVIVIDFPQVINISENRSADQLLEQDVVSLCKSFNRLGIRETPMKILHEVKARAGVDVGVSIRD